MPKISIKERDLTTNAIATAVDQYILYVLPQSVSVIDTNNPSLNKELKNLLTDINAKSGAPREMSSLEAEAVELVDLNHKFLTECIRLGGRVIAALNWEQAANYCGDRNQYDIKYILVDEVADEEGVAAEQKDLEFALAIAEKRKDCVILLNAVSTRLQKNTEKLCEEQLGYITPASDNFFRDEKQIKKGKYVFPFFAKGGLHKVSNPDIYIKANEAFVEAFLNNLNQGRPEGLTVAGAINGVIPNDYEVDGVLKEDEIDAMQPKEYSKDGQIIAVNPICNIHEFGTRIWGNRTALPNDCVLDDTGHPGVNGTDQRVATSFANVRIAINRIKKAMYKSSRRYQFEQNSDVLWVNFKSSINVLLEELKQSNIISGYRWQRLETPARATLRADLQVVPVEGTEDFLLGVELDDNLNAEIAE